MNDSTCSDGSDLSLDFSADGLGLGLGGGVGKSKRRFPSVGSNEWFQEDLDFEVADDEVENSAGYDRCRSGSLLARQRSPLVTGGVGLGTSELLLVPQVFHAQRQGSGSAPGRSGIGLLLTAMPPPKAPPPQHILEAPLATQLLWHSTAGQRPPQPPDVRELVSKLWSKNYRESACVAPHADPGETNGGDEEIGGGRPRSVSVDGGEHARQLFAGRSLHSSTVFKSFHMVVQHAPRADCDVESSQRRHRFFPEGAPPQASLVLTMGLQVPRYRVVSRIPAGWARDQCVPRAATRAEFLVVVSVGEGAALLTLGVWRRYSAFLALAQRLQALCVQRQDREVFGNSLVSWQCVEARRHWGRCLEPEYLELKCHLLERFLHDLLFESAGPDDIADFLGLDATALLADPTLLSLMPKPPPAL